MAGGYSTVPTYRKGRTYETVGPNDRGGCAGILSILFLVVFLLAPPALLWTAERGHYQTFTALQEMVEKGISPFSFKSIPGDIVHLSTPIDNTSSSQVVTSDPDMGVSVTGALSVNRQTEFCQWQEITNQKCQTCTRTVKAKDGSTSEESYDCNCVTEYSYMKSWTNRLIPSFMFDQPGAHHNPQRNPLPSSKFFIDAPLEVSVMEDGTEEATVMLPPSLFHNMDLPKRKINWVKGGVPKPPGFFSRFFARFFGPDTTRYDPLRELAGTESSKAALEHQFVYVGQGGYFFSPYQSSNYGKLLNLFVQYMEGSLMDWQLGDLMPSCTAGDIRIHYKVQDPSEISVVAQVSSKIGVDIGVGQQSPLQLSMYTADDTSTKIALVQEGDRSVSEMIHAAVKASSQSTWMFRAVLVIWSFVLAKLIAAYLGLDLYNSTRVVSLAATTSIASGTLGVTWMTTWGARSPFAQWDIGLCVCACVALGALALQHATKANTPGSWNAVWCMMGRWAKVSPSWRQEETYLKHEHVPIPTQEYPMDGSIPFPTKEKTKSF